MARDRQIIESMQRIDKLYQDIQVWNDRQIGILRKLSKVDDQALENYLELTEPLEDFIGKYRNNPLTKDKS